MEEYCSHFDYKNFIFAPPNELIALHAQLLATFPEAFCYQVKATSFDNKYGYVFKENDYQKLGRHMLFVLAIHAVHKQKPVRLLDDGRQRCK